MIKLKLLMFAAQTALNLVPVKTYSAVKNIQKDTEESQELKLPRKQKVSYEVRLMDQQVMLILKSESAVSFLSG